MRISTLLLATALLALATPASALGLCGLDDEKQSGADAESASSRVVDGERTSPLAASPLAASPLAASPLAAAVEFGADAGPGTEIIEAIVPCAFIESGAFGAFCADATVYVMTDSGLVLCQVPMLALEVDAGDGSEVQHRDASTTSSFASGLKLAADQGTSIALQAPPVLLVAPSPPGQATLLGPKDRSRPVPVLPG